MSGRKQHPVWLCFTRDSSCRTNIKGKCKGCGEVVQGLVGRLEKHASCCRRLAALGLFGADHFASPSASHSQSQSPPEQGSQDTGGTGGDPLVEPTGEPQRKKACVQTTLPVVRTENKEHSQLNVQLCRFVISANCPFSLVDYAEFARFVQLLRPGARLPTRQTLSGPVLDSVYDAELERAAGQVEGKYGTVCIDGWSSITAEPVIGISLSVTRRSFLCDTIDTSGHPHTIVSHGNRRKGHC